ncbi:hypothetical protein ACWOFR_06805 [Carnobacterium gallinarum]|uniref:hypothetical protein n=1 Tax=Carnobacterium gallinarum TaxID=2749 RepID=UPI0005586783|nr:hypothetical protein [Carnobacterium gallinarum]
MTGETIQFVKEAEEQGSKIEELGQIKKQQILDEAQEELRLKEVAVQDSLENYKNQQQLAYQKKLIEDQAQLTAELNQTLEEITQQVTTRKTEVVEDIVREVIRQYGHR